MLKLIILTTLLAVTNAPSIDEADRNELNLGIASKVFNETQNTFGKYFWCLTPFGVYPDIQDCRRYWYCYYWKATLYTCFEWQLYDAYYGICKPRNEVNCGLRPDKMRPRPPIMPPTRPQVTTKAKPTPPKLKPATAFPDNPWKPIFPSVQPTGKPPGRTVPPSGKSTIKPGTAFSDNPWKPISPSIQPTGKPSGRTLPPPGKDILSTFQTPEKPGWRTKSPNEDSSGGTWRTKSPNGGDSSEDSWRTNSPNGESTGGAGRTKSPNSDSSGSTWRTKSSNDDSSEESGRTKPTNDNSSEGSWRTKSPNDNSSGSSKSSGSDTSGYVSDKTFDWTNKETSTTIGSGHSTQNFFTIAPTATSNIFNTQNDNKGKDEVTSTEERTTSKGITSSVTYDYTPLPTTGTIPPDGDVKRFKCPAAFGTYPHEDCSKYYVCVMGEVSIGTCEESELYDPSIFKCQKRENVKCGTRFDPKAIEISFDCPISFGIYPHPRDCSKFVICFSGKVSFGDCHPTQRFDLRYYQCRTKNDVDCGDKFNP